MNRSLPLMRFGVLLAGMLALAVAWLEPGINFAVRLSLGQAAVVDFGCVAFSIFWMRLKR